MKVNYKRNVTYNTAKYPIRQPRFFTWLIYVLCKMLLKGKQYKIEKINMEGLKPPYLILSNHQHFMDFKLAGIATYPHRVNNVVNLDGYYHMGWLMELIGAIATRKFSMDLHLIKSIKKVLKRGDVCCIYPEARYTPIGTTAMLPESLGKIVKMMKVPLVTTVHRGNYLYSPFWDFRRKRKVPFHTTLTQTLTAEQIEQMSVEEINEVIKKALEYDEYRYQKENGILITEPFRAEGLHKVLYQCPHCKTESKMDSKGSEIFCTECGKRWNLNEDGSLSALEGETEFSHIPDWFEWERSEVRKQIDSGEYVFEDEVDLYTLPSWKKFYSIGKAKLRHDAENGFIVEGSYRNKDFRLVRKPLESIGLHVEYDHTHFIPLDCFDISTEEDSYFCYPSKKDVITKLSFAVEEAYKKKKEELDENK